MWIKKTKKKNQKTEQSTAREHGTIAREQKICLKLFTNVTVPGLRTLQNLQGVKNETLLHLKWCEMRNQLKQPLFLLRACFSVPVQTNRSSYVDDSSWGRPSR